MVAAVDSQEHLCRLLTDSIPSIAGVAASSPGLCLEVIKFESNQVPYST